MYRYYVDLKIKKIISEDDIITRMHDADIYCLYPAFDDPAKIGYATKDRWEKIEAKCGGIVTEKWFREYAPKLAYMGKPGKVFKKLFTPMPQKLSQNV